MLNVIQNLKCGVAANLQYTLPKSGSFLAIWTFNDDIYSATYRYIKGVLAVYDQEQGGFVEVGNQTTSEHYGLCDLQELIENGFLFESQFVAVVTLEAA